MESDGPPDVSNDSLHSSDLPSAISMLEAVSIEQSATQTQNLRDFENLLDEITKPRNNGEGTSEAQTKLLSKVGLKVLRLINADDPSAQIESAIQHLSAKLEEAKVPERPEEEDISDEEQQSVILVENQGDENPETIKSIIQNVQEIPRLFKAKEISRIKPIQQEMKEIKAKTDKQEKVLSSVEQGLFDQHSLQNLVAEV